MPLFTIAVEGTAEAGSPLNGRFARGLSNKLYRSNPLSGRQFGDRLFSLALDRHQAWRMLGRDGAVELRRSTLHSTIFRGGTTLLARPTEAGTGVTHGTWRQPVVNGDVAEQRAFSDDKAQWSELGFAWHCRSA